MLKMIDLFAGIGGFSYAAEPAGFETVAFCEIDKYCSKTLAKNLQHVRITPSKNILFIKQISVQKIAPETLTNAKPAIHDNKRHASYRKESRGIY